MPTYSIYGVASGENAVFVINVTTLSYTIVSVGCIPSIKKSVDVTVLSFRAYLNVTFTADAFTVRADSSIFKEDATALVPLATSTPFTIRFD